MKKYNRIWMIIMSMLLLFCQPLTVSATEPSAEQESETEEDEGDLQDEEESGSPEADGQEGEDADEDEVEEDPEEYAELEAVINEAKESLKAVTSQETVMALVFLCDTYGVRETPGEDGKVSVRVPTGTTVQIDGFELDEEWNIWYHVSLTYNDRNYSGYIDRNYLAYSNEAFLAWEDVCFPKSSMFTTYEGGSLDVEQFPASYKSKLTQLKQAHPNWIFVKQDTGLDWQTVVKNENYQDRNLISSIMGDAYKNGLYGSGWYYASKEAVEYYLDPRNFLDDIRIFQFEQLTYNPSYHSKSAVDKILSTTFMKGELPGAGMSYASAFYEIGVKLKVSPFHLACRVYQEQGKGTSALISGTYSGYEGYYNYYNIGATGKTTEENVKSGLEKAKKEGWNTRYKSLNGGAVILSKEYILKGQDTLYLQKFDVDPSFSGLYWHQYMQNIMAPYTESQMVKRAYTETGSLDNPFVFKIPVYNNMPSAACPVPGTASTPKPTATATPTAVPTATPTARPTPTASASPTATPSAIPSETPSERPTVQPTLRPTVKPTAASTATPTAASATPGATPTAAPSVTPVEKPTQKPITTPTETPAKKPTASPTNIPSVSPTKKPLVTATPTVRPTAKPTEVPRGPPTQMPTYPPKQNPTIAPTKNPTVSPTEKPTASPTTKPTASPTLKPTASPSAGTTPTAAVAPTASASPTATAVPTAKPTPTQKPTAAPTAKPTQNPAREPEDEPPVVTVEVVRTPEPTPAETTAPAAQASAEPAQPPAGQQDTETEVTVTAATPKPQTAPEDKSVVTFDMSDNSMVYTQTLEQIREQGKKVTLEMGNGIVWRMDGSTMGEAPLNDIDFKVTMGKSGIPKLKKDALTEGENYVELSLAHDGGFGFTAVLSVTLENAQPGQYANLFYYDETEGEFQFMCASIVGSTKEASFEFAHASDYIIIISDDIKENLLELRAPQMEEAERIIQEELNNPANEKPAEEPKKAAGIITLIILGSIAVVIAIYLIFRKKDE